jgi:peptidoglycan/xylan/chitin deacetylase (PgdA/CDA1 family)
MSESAPNISVVVAAYNRRQTLAETLDSLLAQTNRDWEAIVVDDGSTDGTGELAERYAEDDPRIRAHRQPNGGVSSARNAGVELARGKWLFFLDADDWIVPRAFERLLAAAAGDPAPDAVVGACQRVDEEGRELEVQPAEREPDLFHIFARTCAIVIHSCLVRTELVRRVGAFDESLVTCEDWDLWQRISRVGARFAAIHDVVAVYRMRGGSASHDGWRMLHDGFVVIDRGHGEDPRLTDHRMPERRRLSTGHRDLAKTYLACYAAGLEIAAGRDPDRMVAALGESASEEASPDGVAETLFHSIAGGRGVPKSGWGELPPSVYEAARSFVTALGERVGDRWFGSVGLGVLERLVLAQTSSPLPFHTGRWYVTELDCEGGPPDLELPEGVERVICKVRCGERELGDLEVAAIDGWMPERVLADAVASTFAWDILQGFFERHVYPGLEIEAGEGRATVRRGRLLLFDGELNPLRGTAEGVHDEIGWTLLLQELWGIRTLTAEDFHNGRRDGLEDLRGPLRSEDGRFEVELSAPPRPLRVPPGVTARVEVRVAGVPLTVVEGAPTRGWVPIGRLRRAILEGAGFELCRSVVREAILMAPTGAGGSLRERLAAGAARPARLDGATAIGRGAGRDGTSASRWTVFPAAAAAERLDLARRDGDPVSRPPGGDGDRLTVGPFALDGDRGAAALSDDSLRRSIRVERLRGEGDGRAGHGGGDLGALLSPLLPGRADRALQLGCSGDAVTRALSELAGELTVADISAAALEAARREHGERRGVRFAQLDAFEGSLGGPYELIVCAGPLAYAESRDALEGSLRRLAGALAPGGLLLLAGAAREAAAVRAAAARTRLLDPGETRESGGRAAHAHRRRAAKRVALAPIAARRNGAVFVGGRIASAPEYPQSTRLAILMYHRVGPRGSAATARWRLRPDQFEEQLAYLREHEYRSLTFPQWRAASDRRDPIPERSVMLTFDDGYADFGDHALPLLERYGFRATVFIVTDRVGGTNAWDQRFGETIALMDWPEIEALHRAGVVEFGSHSSQHHPLVALSPEELGRDLCRSRIAFHERLGVSVRTVCYPYGLHDSGVVAIAAACGFHYGVTTEEWRASFTDDSLRLPRLEVAGTESLADFAAKLRA